MPMARACGDDRVTLAIVILAAGQSSRMRGTDKLAGIVDGQPLLTRVAMRALATGCPVWATLPAPDHPRAALLPPGVSVVPVTDAANGMGRSIAGGIAALPAHVTAAMILPADMPDLTTDDLCAMIAAYAGGILRATASDGTAGHPVIFPRACFAQMQALSGDDGARTVISANSAALNWLALPERHALTDLDTPEDWADWHSARPEGQAASKRIS